MPNDSSESGSLALASSIAQMNRDEMRELIAQRRIASPSSVTDPLSLALELLRPESIRIALRSTDRASLNALRVLGQRHGATDATHDTAHGTAHDTAHGGLRRSGLIGLEHDRPTALPEVTAALAATGIDLDSGAAPTHDAGETEGQEWFGHALTAVGYAAALLRALTRTRVRRGRTGDVTVTVQRELAEAVHGEPEAIGRLLRLLDAAGMTGTDPNATQSMLVPTPTAREWLAAAPTERWISLATAHAARLSPELRHAISHSGPDLTAAASTVLRYEFPLLHDSTRHDAEDWAATAELIGLSWHGRLSSTAQHLLSGKATAAHDETRGVFPACAQGLYLQHDLSVIVPGPLSPADEAFIAALASIEQVGAATTYRLSQTSLARALRAGIGIDEMRSELARLSLTGIPQPIEYLLSDLERTHAPQPHPPQPAAPATPAPATAPAGAHVEHTEHTEFAARAPHVAATAGLDIDALTDRVLAGAEDDAGDLSRRLDLAIRSRQPVLVTARAGADERTFTLLPASLTGGRLRASDQRAGVERTLPLSAIVSVESAAGPADSTTTNATAEATSNTTVETTANTTVE